MTPDEIVPVCATRIPDPRLRRAIEGVKSARDLEALPLIWREPGAGTRRVVESALTESGVNRKNLDLNVVHLNNLTQGLANTHSPRAHVRDPNSEF